MLLACLREGYPLDIPESLWTVWFAGARFSMSSTRTDTIIYHALQR